MNFPLEIELQGALRRERLLAEAESDRLASQLRGPGRSVVRARVAAALYTVADWLSADARGLTVQQTLGKAVH